MDFPAWQTSKDVLSYGWHRRVALARFSAVPVIIVVVLSMALYAAVPTALRAATSFITIVFQTLAFLPVTVTWYRIVVWGEEAARNRPLFAFGRIEQRLLGWQILLLLISAAATAIAYGSILLLMKIGSFFITEGTFGQYVVIGIVIAWGITIAVGFLIAGTRLSMVLALVALDQPVSFKAAWRMAIGVGPRIFTSVAIASLLVVLVMLPLFIVVGVIQYFSTVGEYLNIAFQGVANLLIQLSAVTAFGFAYNRLTNPSAQTIAAETPTQT